MPLGFERLNERTQRPNSLINFIKPLPGPDSKYAQDFLERVAAVSYPIMRAHTISVMALEEYEPNKEFLGRNFNAGEIIQLVLKSPRGGWLPFRHVQMVMMHELAHCKQMNHSRDFWKCRNAYSEHLVHLWTLDYTGEGMWGRGQTLLSGRYATDRMPDGASEVTSLCGGTYRGRGRKRKRGGEAADRPKITYAERQQKRIAKKFGIHGGGVTVGEDEIVKNQLEPGKHLAGKPRVASSKRGRDLRVAAALARFDLVKTTPKDEPQDSGSETESDYGEEFDFGDLKDAQGVHVIDARGNGLVRVCGDEDANDDNVKRELDELREIDRGLKPGDKIAAGPRHGSKIPPPTIELDSPSPAKPHVKHRHDSRESSTELETDTRTQPLKASKQAPASAIPANQRTTKTRHSSRASSTASEADPQTQPRKHLKPPLRPAPASNPQRQSTQRPAPQATTEPAYTHITAPPPGTCPICSLANDPSAATCLACAHVLDARKISRVWHCTSVACRESGYLNAGDCGICGICGASESTAART